MALQARGRSSDDVLSTARIWECTVHTTTMQREMPRDISRPHSSFDCPRGQHGTQSRHWFRV
jgi:hypothetical protein